MKPGYGVAPLEPARGRPDERRPPDGFVVRLDPRARRLDRADGGLALLGLSPGRLLHLAPAAQRMLAGDQLVVRDAASARLARRLLDAGVAHPVVPAGVTAVGPGEDEVTAVGPGEDEVTAVGPGEDEVTAVVPVRDRPEGLRALLTALAATAPGLAEVIVVDDGSTDPDAHRAAVEQHGTDSALAGRVRLIRHPTARGPAAGRNAGLAAAATSFVAFLDSDVVPEPGWLAPLRAHLADPAVALAAPRVVALPVEASAARWLDRYEGLRSSLDLGPHPALIAPRTRVAYVPSAALLVRRAALGTGGFAEQLRVAEDVDLVLRLHAEGWRLRYEPAARVAHRHRTSAAAWWVRKAFYGTGAAPLALRHPRAVPPLVLAPWAGAVCLLVAAQRTLGWLGAVGVTASAWWRLRGTLGGVRQPGRVAVLLVGLGLVNAAHQVAGLLLRHWWPVALPASVVSRRVRRAVLVAALGEGLLDWYRHRPARSAADRPRQPGLDPLRYLLAHRADDLGYGAGLWWGALRHRTLAPLRPQLTVNRRPRHRR